MLTAYITAETALLKGQTVRHGDRLLTRANLEEVQAGRREWQQIVDQLTAASDGQGARYRFGSWNDV